MLNTAGKKIKAILFDLGDTLLNFGRIQTSRVFYQSARQTYEFLQSCNQPVGGFKRYYLHSMAAIRLRCLVSALTGKDFNALSLLKKIGIRKGFTLSDEQWQQLGWSWYEPLAKQAQIEPGLKKTLASFKQMGLKLGIVSNTFISDDSLDRHLAQFRILDFFPLRLYSHQFDFRKPDVRIFQAAAKKIGELPQNILFVGMGAVLKEAYTNIGKKIPRGVWMINQLSELPALIEKINGETSQQEIVQKEFCV
jgi:FMN phosphatase YigB (HAD superfamily)